MMFKPMVDEPARERAVVASALRLIAEGGDVAFTTRAVALEVGIPQAPSMSYSRPRTPCARR